MPKDKKKVKAKKKREEEEEEEEDQPKGKKKKDEDDEEEEEKTEDKYNYAGDKQPRWVTSAPDSTIESPAGYRVHIWGDKGEVMVTGKDWEGEGKDGSEGLHPGKVIKMPIPEFVGLLNGVLKEMGWEGPEIELPSEDEEEEDE